MRILMLDTSYGTGGSSRVIFELSQQLSLLGHTVNIQAFNLEKTYYQSNNDAVSSLGNTFLSTLKGEFSFDNYDIIHAHSPTTLFFKYLFNLPLIYHFHGSPLNYNYPSNYSTLILLKLM